MNVTPKYHVVVSPVREVSLIASADAAFWSRQLEPLGLHPTVDEGRAQLVVTGAEMKFKCILFRELSVSVFVCNQSGSAARDGAYLLQAWNTVRFFAWVERTFFHTPYAHGEVVVDSIPPEAVGAYRRNMPLLSVMMGRLDPSSSRPVSRSGYEVWEGPLYLPGPTPRMFHARLEGETNAYPFHSEVDAVTIQPVPEFPALQQLIDSDFRGREWLVRSSATHGKSKTVRR